ncbi:MAG TPA: XdhC family protein [Anaerolineales bacterium]|nr:XdhC family protein [Anaerolineales bacterium]
MRDILTNLIQWRDQGQSVALATVVQTWGSSPRKVASKMALTNDGRIIGSVSGGCVENAVVEAGLESLQTGKAQLLHFGVADETAWEVGLACGGSIDIFVKPLDMDFFEEVRAVLEDERSAVTVTVVRGPDELLGRELLFRENGQITGTLGNEWDGKVLTLVQETLAQGISCRVELNEDVEVFIEAILPSPTLIVVGGVHIAVSLVSLAKMLGYRTILIDPRKAWGNDDRFPHVDKLIQSWPEDAFEQTKITRSTAIAMLTHDPKLDDPALKIALNSSAFYVGALGSKATHAKRRERLLNDGVPELQLSSLHAPIGLKIGAQSPEEIALSIMAEVVDAHRKQNQTSVKDEAKPVLSL